MKNLLYLFFLNFCLVGCLPYYGVYSVGLQNVERSDAIKENYAESKIVNFKEAETSKYSYEDDLIKAVWLPMSTQFSFTLENKTDNSIKIIWDEAAYVDEKGSSGRVMHSGVKFIDRSNPQPPTVIVKKAKIDDIIIPTDNVYFVSGQYGGWRTKPLFPNRAATQEELKLLSENYIGKTIKILLPLQIQENISEYIFTFNVENFTQKTSN